MLRPNSACIELNATETELLDQFGCVKASDRKGAVGKDRRKSGGTSLRSEAPNESEVE